jgi:hypothetical protein
MSERLVGNGVLGHGRTRPISVVRAPCLRGDMSLWTHHMNVAKALVAAGLSFTLLQVEGCSWKAVPLVLGGALGGALVYRHLDSCSRNCY